jgi:WhiB family redox-sensing transcriptional regulator
MKPDWREKANCVGTDAESFFPDTVVEARAAIRVCRRCEVQVECLGFARRERIEFGVWGGVWLSAEAARGSSGGV